MTRLRVVAAGLVVAVVGGCGGGPATPTLSIGGVSRQQPAADAPVGDVAAAITRLGYSLESSARGNSVISPLSIAYAFAMARAGAGGATAAQLDQVLGFPSTGLHESEAVFVAGRPPVGFAQIGRVDGSPTSRSWRWCRLLDAVGRRVAMRREL